MKTSGLYVKSAKQLNGTWEWKGWIYVPARKELREKVIQSCHKAPTAGHPRVAKTLELITQGFWWPQMKHDIKTYIKACHTCQTVKPN